MRRSMRGISPWRWKSTCLPPPGEAPPPAAEVGETAGRAISPPVGLAAAMLPGEDKQVPHDAQSNLPALGESLRRALRQAAQPGTDTSSTAAVPERRGDPAAGSPGISEDPREQDRRLRRLAALAGTAARDPFQPLRRRALQELLLWHGQRAIDDFWAASDPNRPPYFATAGRACLDDVPRLGPPDPPITRESQRLRDLLEHRSQAARTGLEILSTDLLLIDEATDLTAQIGLRTTPQTPDLPAGSAAVCLCDERGPLPGTIRLIEMPPGGEPSADGVRRSRFRWRERIWPVEVRGYRRWLRFAATSSPHL